MRCWTWASLGCSRIVRKIRTTIAVRILPIVLLTMKIDLSRLPSIYSYGPTVHRKINLTTVIPKVSISLLYIGERQTFGKATRQLVRAIMWIWNNIFIIYKCQLIFSTGTQRYIIRLTVLRKILFSCLPNSYD